MNRLISVFKVHPNLAVLSAVFFFILLRLPSLIEPYWYGDEGIYAVIGQSLRDGAVLYRDIWDNKPPGLYLIYALFNGDLVWVKGLSMVFGALNVGVFYLLAKRLLKTKLPVFIATIAFTVLFGLPILEGNIANAENFMLLPICLAFYLVIRFYTPKAFAAAGFLLAIAAMIKIVAIFDIAALLFIAYIFSINKKNKTVSKTIDFLSSKKLILFLISALVLPVVVLLYFLSQQSLSYLFSSVLTNNVDYVGVNNYLLFPLGLVFLKVALLLGGLTALFIFRNKLTDSEVVVYSWLTFALFSVFFSERPYTHYLLMGLMPYALLVGLLVKKIKIFPLILFLSVTIISYTYFNIYLKNQSYYSNFVNFVLGNKSYSEYIAFFDRSSVVDYEVASYLKRTLQENETVYFWSDSAQLYLLSEVYPITKYIVAYHNLASSEAMQYTGKQLQAQNPDHIVVKRNSPFPFELLHNYELKYTIESAKIYEKNI